MNNNTIECNIMPTSAGSGEYNSNWFAVEVWSPEFGGEMQAAFKKLEALEPNWDAQGALAIDSAIIKSARNLVDHLPENICPIPSVVPLSNGTFQFEWNDEERSLEFEFEAPGQLRYLMWAPSHGIEEEQTIQTDNYSQIVKLIRWFTGATLNA